MSDFEFIGEGVPKNLPIIMSLMGIICALASSLSIYDHEQNKSLSLKPNNVPSLSINSIEPIAPEKLSLIEEDIKEPKIEVLDSGIEKREPKIPSEMDFKIEEIEAPKPKTKKQSYDCPQFEPILFGRGGRNPIKDLKDWLVPIKEWSDKHPNQKIILNGHSDSGGNEFKNFKLGQARAQSVLIALKKAGISQKRLQTRSFGAFKPLEGLKESDPANRRVEVEILNCSGEND